MKSLQVTMMLGALAMPAAAQVQEGAEPVSSKPKEIVVVGSKVSDADNPVVLGRLYNPTRALLLEPRDLETLGAGNLREATLAVPQGPFLEALKWAFENRQTIGDLKLSIATTGGHVAHGETTLTDIMVTHVSRAADRYDRVKVQFHWDRTEAPAGGPLIGKAIGNVGATPQEDPAVTSPDGWGSPSVLMDVKASAAVAARFSITIDGYEIASFFELAGINSSVEPVTIVLKRGKTRSPEMWAWHEAVQAGNMAAARKSASLVMYNYEGKPVARYHLENAWPSKVEIGGLAAQGNVSDFEFLKARASRGGEVAMEEVTIVSENIQRVAQ